jgi:hypothetical protein
MSLGEFGKPEFAKDLDEEILDPVGGLVHVVPEASHDWRPAKIQKSALEQPARGADTIRLASVASPPLASGVQAPGTRDESRGEHQTEEAISSTN